MSGCRSLCGLSGSVVLIAVLIALLGLNSASFALIEPIQTPAPQESAIPVEFCKLVSSPRYYEGKLVRLRASYLVNFESDILYDLRCGVTKNFVAPVLDCKDDEDCEVLKAALNRDLKGDPFGGSRVELIVVGRLIGADEYVRRYGHSVGTNLGFSISRIEQSNRIKRSVPWPGRKKSTRHRTRR